MITSLSMVCQLAESVTSFVLPFWIVLQRHIFYFNLLLWIFIHTSSGVMCRHHCIDGIPFIYHSEGKNTNMGGGYEAAHGTSWVHAHKTHWKRRLCMVVVYVAGHLLRWTIGLDKQSCQECAPLLQHVKSDIAKFPALVIFVAAYGCIGLELVSIEHDNPFGDDPNDFDILILDKVRQFLLWDSYYIYIYPCCMIQNPSLLELARRMGNPSTKMACPLWRPLINLMELHMQVYRNFMNLIWPER
jgi:hypothetical protein